MCEKYAIKPHERLLFSTEWISYDQIKKRKLEDISPYCAATDIRFRLPVT